MTDNNNANLVISRIAAAIGEPARVRILYSLLDGHARTSTELAAVAEVTPSTTSVHLQRLKQERLVKVVVQGKHRFYTLAGGDVASALEALSLVASGSRSTFVPKTPQRLLEARTCYDHLAGKIAVLLYKNFQTSGWLSIGRSKTSTNCDLTAEGEAVFSGLGIDLAEVRSSRRRFAYECLDWSERSPHLAGALGGALLKVALKKKWVVQDLDCRALDVTTYGRREMRSRFGVQF